MHIRRGRPHDLASLMSLEAASFEPQRRESEAVILRSLRSQHQEVWVVTVNRKILGSLFLRFHRRTAKVHSIAIDPGNRGSGIGGRLLDWAGNRARRRGCSILSLEADARSEKLLEWYRRHGFAQTSFLQDYYGPGWPALRLARSLDGAPAKMIP